MSWRARSGRDGHIDHAYRLYGRGAAAGARGGRGRGRAGSGFLAVGELTLNDKPAMSYILRALLTPRAHGMTRRQITI